MVAAPLRIVFFGTPAFAVPALEALLESPHDVVGVVTQPDRPRGRGQKTSHAPVKARALAAGVPVVQPDALKDAAFVAALAGTEVGFLALPLWVLLASITLLVSGRRSEVKEGPPIAAATTCRRGSPSREAISPTPQASCSSLGS